VPRTACSGFLLAGANLSRADLIDADLGGAFQCRERLVQDFYADECTLEQGPLTLMMGFSAANGLFRISTRSALA